MAVVLKTSISGHNSLVLTSFRLDLITDHLHALDFVKNSAGFSRASHTAATRDHDHRSHGCTHRRDQIGGVAL